jgi:tRNA nucleotidyltransferase (CCA-adding enzyme)
MNIAFGHSNMDLDCLGSLIIIKKLYPDYRLVRSRLIHPAAAHLYEFYKDFFGFINPKDLEKERIENIIIVDTCVAERVHEFLRFIRDSEPAIRIIDHHDSERCDILGARLEGRPYGANTSYLGKLAMERGITLLPEEATIALTGIFADTGRLIYENVCREDFEVAAWLLDQGASLKLVKSFLETVTEDGQIETLNRLLPALRTQVIQGHSVLLSYLELAENISGLAAVVEKVMELQNPDAYFALFFIPRDRTILLIARSQRSRIDLHELLHVYGGGGHHLAAAAKIQNREGPAFYEEFLAYLEKSLAPAVRARDIMTRNLRSIHEDNSLMEASMLMEESEVSGVPVLNKREELCGFIGLKDIMKGRRASCMKAPVKAYMSRQPIWADGSRTMREIERIFYRHHISHLLIMEDGKLAGIISRWDYLRFRKRKAGEAAGP